MSDLMRVLNGGPALDDNGATFSGFHEGVIDHVVGLEAFFTLPAWDEERVFGPAMWHAAVSVDVSGGSGDPAFASHHHALAAPSKGQLCVVVFVTPGVERPWIVAWSDA